MIETSIDQTPSHNYRPWKIGFGLLWLSFSAYAFLFSPPDNPAATLELIRRLSSIQSEGINPLVVYLFNIMGVLPMMYSCVLYSDGRGQKIPAWPFVVGSFFLGAFALLPYLVLRQPNPQFVGAKGWYLRLWDSKITAIVVAVLGITLLILGVTQGNWPDFVQQWQTERFIHVMSLDFCMLSLLFPFLIKDDMARRGMTDQYFWAFAAVPLLGALAYLVVRPALVETEVEE
ncbi:DUF2834 domain-containing protein [filamentous cyanobacterium LEGE 11480]|uniref:DUF2834 domain-containing protein n=1 Tax=Romeriopsis navalis LEGE 11480 TaxID=2777977 RepID=A0A928VM48_9CYAN|nr:DUF2834 domain-containing protein [Romeriopsis navalis]MBE9028529.1 DUF2834 domain-containing protein [Romeriopsis navalis LEGE 11480]